MENKKFDVSVILPINTSTIKDFEDLLDKTKGIWTKGDGLEYQQKIREEWI